MRARPILPAREDSEDERNGVVAIFCAVAPHLGWRCIEERERKTRCDSAAFLRALADEHFPDAERIVLVLDNLHTHSPPRSTRRSRPRRPRGSGRASNSTSRPSTGAGLNIAQIALSALARGCLARRIPVRPTLTREWCAWLRDRNEFTTADARNILIKPFPSLHE